MWPRNDMKLMEIFGGHAERTHRALWKPPWHAQLKESLAANLARYLLHRAAMAMQVREKGRAISACLTGKRGACRDVTGQTDICFVSIWTSQRVCSNPALSASGGNDEMRPQQGQRAAPFDQCFLEACKSRPCSDRTREKRCFFAPCSRHARLRNILKPEARQFAGFQALWASHGLENGRPPAVRLMCCDRQRQDWETAIRSAARVCELQSLAWPVTGRELSFRAWDCGSAQTQAIADETSLSVFLESPDPDAPDGLRASLCQSRALPPHRDSFRDDCKHRVSLATGDA
ncbi:hypothetical protein CT0861_06735 [Colletotrichum tofieldiae]|uniref:Uncharacterized protein n=1 Tax=Colletotrichum tofieldiae TaxID=708197 RepID=A0A166TL18_9PEZI|nr:hypothetical protein CT0861_06735 [Colletotrichum tofieldiae]